MSVKHSAERIAALTAVSLAVANCGESHKNLSHFPAELGKEAVAGCIDSPRPITPDRSDLGHSVNVAGIYKQLDEGSFTSPKAIDELTHKRTDTDLPFSAPFFKIVAKSGNICYGGVRGVKLRRRQKEGILAAVVEDAPFITAASREKALSQVIFRLVEKDETLPGINADDPEQFKEVVVNGKAIPAIEYPLDPRHPVPAEDIRTMLRHEVFHALTDNIDMSADEVIHNEKRAKEFAEACLGVRNIADKQAAEHAEKVIGQLSQIAALANPAQAEVIHRVITSIRNGDITKLEPVSGEYSHKKSWELGIGNVAECTNESPWYLALRIMEQKGVNTKSLLTNHKVQGLIGSALDSWNARLRNHTIYYDIREATYLGDDKRSDEEGHPYDNWDETITSTLNVAITYPKEFAANVKRLSENERTAIKELLNECVKTFAEAQPHLPSINQRLRQIVTSLHE